MVWVDLEVGQGAEQSKTRPAVVVTNDGANIAAERVGHGVVAVVPMTTNTRQSRHFQVLVSRQHSGLRDESVVQCEQIRSVDISRVTTSRYILPQSVMEEIDSALMIQLGLRKPFNWG